MPSALPPQHAAFPKQINRLHSPFLARVVPWLSIMLGSFCVGLPLIASAPILPPFSFLLLIAWRQLRPGVLPVWAGLPLGLFDDLFSGQPFGSAILLWSVTMIAMEIVEARFPWRSFVTDWLAASLMIMLYLLLGLGLSNAAGGQVPTYILLPQMPLSALVFPLAGRLVNWLDALRLLRFRTIS